MERLQVRTVRLSSPNVYRSLVWVDTPDLLVATFAIFGELGVRIVDAGRRGPDLCDKWNRWVVRFEDVDSVGDPLDQGRRHDHDIRDEVHPVGTSKATRIDPHLELVAVKLSANLEGETHAESVVVGGHGRLLPQSATPELPLTVRILQHDGPQGLFCYWHSCAPRPGTGPVTSSIVPARPRNGLEMATGQD